MAKRTGVAAWLGGVVASSPVTLVPGVDDALVVSINVRVMDDKGA